MPDPYQQYCVKLKILRSFANRCGPKISMMLCPFFTDQGKCGEIGFFWLIFATIFFIPNSVLAAPFSHSIYYMVSAPSRSSTSFVPLTELIQAPDAVCSASFWKFEILAFYGTDIDQQIWISLQCANWLKVLIDFSLGLRKGVKATGEAVTSQKRTSRTSKHEIS